MKKQTLRNRLRFFKQRTGLTCGPIALMNLRKCLDIPTTYAGDFERYRKKCRCYGKRGTSHELTLRLAREFADVKRIAKPTPYKMWKALRKGNFLLVRENYWHYEWQKPGAHVFVIVAYSGGRFLCANFDKKGHPWIKVRAFDPYFSRLQVYRVTQKSRS